MLRDKSTLTLGIILPLILLIIFGYGLSLDVNNVDVALVRDTSSPITRDLYFALLLSPSFSPRMVDSMARAKELLINMESHAIVRHEAAHESDGRIQIIVNGRDANSARIMQRYLEAAIALWLERRLSPLSEKGGASLLPRIWFNDALESRFFLVPGVTVLIMTLIGCLLTALVVAREWERGTFEALAATNVLRSEIIISKTLPYFVLGLIGLFLSLLAARLIFEVPMRGSFLLIIATSSIYLVASLGIGLLISTISKSQFLSSQVVLLASFMPTIMMSGFIFDLKSAPLIAQYIAHMFPATWYVELLQTLFLVGNVPEIIIRDTVVLLFFAVLFLSLAIHKMQKTLE